MYKYMMIYVSLSDSGTKKRVSSFGFVLSVDEEYGRGYVYLKYGSRLVRNSWLRLTEDSCCNYD